VRAVHNPLLNAVFPEHNFCRSLAYHIKTNWQLPRTRFSEIQRLILTTA